MSELPPDPPPVTDATQPVAPVEPQINASIETPADQTIAVNASTDAGVQAADGLAADPVAGASGDAAILHPVPITGDPSSTVGDASVGTANPAVVGDAAVGTANPAVVGDASAGTANPVPVSDSTTIGDDTEDDPVEPILNRQFDPDSANPINPGEQHPQQVVYDANNIPTATYASGTTVRSEVTNGQLAKQSVNDQGRVTDISYGQNGNATNIVNYDASGVQTGTTALTYDANNAVTGIRNTAADGNTELLQRTPEGWRKTVTDGSGVPITTDASAVAVNPNGSYTVTEGDRQYSQNVGGQRTELPAGGDTGTVGQNAGTTGDHGTVGQNVGATGDHGTVGQNVGTTGDHGAAGQNVGATGDGSMIPVSTVGPQGDNAAVVRPVSRTSNGSDNPNDPPDPDGDNPVPVNGPVGLRPNSNITIVGSGEFSTIPPVDHGAADAVQVPDAKNKVKTETEVPATTDGTQGTNPNNLGNTSTVPLWKPAVTTDGSGTTTTDPSLGSGLGNGLEVEDKTKDKPIIVTPTTTTGGTESHTTVTSDTDSVVWKPAVTTDGSGTTTTDPSVGSGLSNGLEVEDKAKDKPVIVTPTTTTGGTESHTTVTSDADSVVWKPAVTTEDSSSTGIGTGLGAGAELDKSRTVDTTTTAGAESGGSLTRPSHEPTWAEVKPSSEIGGKVAGHDTDTSLSEQVKALGSHDGVTGISETSARRDFEQLTERNATVSHETAAASAAALVREGREVETHSILESANRNIESGLSAGARESGIKAEGEAGIHGRAEGAGVSAGIEAKGVHEGEAGGHGRDVDSTALGLSTGSKSSSQDESILVGNVGRIGDSSGSSGTTGNIEAIDGAITGGATTIGASAGLGTLQVGPSKEGSFALQEGGVTTGKVELGQPVAAGDGLPVPSKIAEGSAEGVSVAIRADGMAVLMPAETGVKETGVIKSAGLKDGLAAPVDGGDGAAPSKIEQLAGRNTVKIDDPDGAPVPNVRIETSTIKPPDDGGPKEIAGTSKTTTRSESDDDIRKDPRLEAGANATANIIDANAARTLRVLPDGGDSVPSVTDASGAKVQTNTQTSTSQVQSGVPFTPSVQDSASSGEKVADAPTQKEVAQMPGQTIPQNITQGGSPDPIISGQDPQTPGAPLAGVPLQPINLPTFQTDPQGQLGAATNTSSNTTSDPDFGNVTVAGITTSNNTDPDPIVVAPAVNTPFGNDHDNDIDPVQDFQNNWVQAAPEIGNPAETPHVRTSSDSVSITDAKGEGVRVNDNGDVFVGNDHTSINVQHDGTITASAEGERIIINRDGTYEIQNGGDNITITRNGDDLTIATDQTGVSADGSTYHTTETAHIKHTPDGGLDVTAEVTESRVLAGSGDTITSSETVHVIESPDGTIHTEVQGAESKQPGHAGEDSYVIVEEGKSTTNSTGTTTGGIETLEVVTHADGSVQAQYDAATIAQTGGSTADADTTAFEATTNLGAQQTISQQGELPAEFVHSELHDAFNKIEHGQVPADGTRPNIVIHVSGDDNATGIEIDTHGHLVVHAGVSETVIDPAADPILGPHNGTDNLPPPPAGVPIDGPINGPINFDPGAGGGMQPYEPVSSGPVNYYPQEPSPSWTPEPAYDPGYSGSISYSEPAGTAGQWNNSVVSPTSVPSDNFTQFDQTWVGDQFVQQQQAQQNIVEQQLEQQRQEQEAQYTASAYNQDLNQYVSSNTYDPYAPVAIDPVVDGASAAYGMDSGTASPYASADPGLFGDNTVVPPELPPAESIAPQPAVYEQPLIFDPATGFAYDPDTGLQVDPSTREVIGPARSYDLPPVTSDAAQSQNGFVDPNNLPGQPDPYATQNTGSNGGSEPYEQNQQQKTAEEATVISPAPEGLLPPGQDPYIGGEQNSSNMDNAINTLLGVEHDPYSAQDITDGRIEIGYKSSSDNLDDWRVEISEKTEREDNLRRLEEEKDRRERDQREQEEKAKRFADAMLAAMATRRSQEEAAIRAQREQMQNMLQQETRQKYIVLKGDTLESIAQKKLRDRRLSQLLYEINKSLIPIRMEGTKQLLQLKPRMVIYLPTQIEIKRYHSRLFGKQNTKFEYDTQVADAPEATSRQTNPGLIGAEATLAANLPNVPPSKADLAAQKRRANIESLLGRIGGPVEKDGRIRYICRLGDTLRSVAMRHPVLKDVTLWKLLAEVNRLSTKSDDKGVPLAVLKRGETIVMPLPQEVIQFRAKHGRGDSPITADRAMPGSSVISAAGSNPAGATQFFDIVSKPCPHCKVLTTMQASICPACAYSFNKDDSPLPTSSRDTGGGTVIVPDSKPIENWQESSTRFLLAGANPTAGATLDSSESQLDERAVRNVVTAVTDTSRIVSYGSMEANGIGFRIRLEVRREEFWLPVVRYEINEDFSVRHAFTLAGNRKTTRMDLPSAAAKEMAEHDLSSNASQYCEQFLADQPMPEFF